jgi:hypothetical protein
MKRNIFYENAFQSNNADAFALKALFTLAKFAVSYLGFLR